MFVEGLFEVRRALSLPTYCMAKSSTVRTNARAGFMFPTTWRCGCFVVAVAVEALTQEIVGKAVNLGRPYTPFSISK